MRVFLLVAFMLEIKPLLPGDWPLLRAVRLQALADAPKAFGMTLAQASARTEAEWQQNALRFTRLPPAASFLAYADGTPCGMASVFTAEADPQTAELTAFWVAPEQRGQGVGDALVTAITEWAKLQGMTTLQAWVVEDNARALGFYQRIGFQETEERQPHAPNPAKQIRLLRKVIEN
jgi:GNAT superfamily N-acetyltransferase